MENFWSASAALASSACKNASFFCQIPNAKVASEALKTWKRKLSYLQRQEAIAADSAQKFELGEQIDEAKDKIAELEGTVENQSSRDQTVFRADISRILEYAPAQLIGRESELKLLADAWAKVQSQEKSRPHVLTFIALGGEGKTSLVAKWAVDEMLAKGWPGCDAAFAWSFFSQGTREQLAASSDLFLKEALTFFGDEETANSAKHASEKGKKLAELVAQRRSLLMLDGLEPLQYAPTSTAFPPGQLKDEAIARLLKDLAVASHGLCVVTTRYSLPDLKAFWQTTAPEVKLLRLSRDAGVHLLKTLGVRGSAHEFATLVEDVKGHALTLTLLGGFLKRAFRGDIRQRDRVKFEKADEKMDGGHSFRTMAAYEQWLLRDGGDEGRREVAVLRLMGLFDRPADAGCLAALRSETIPGLTDPLAGLADDDWEYCLSGLEAAKLLTVNRDASGALVSLDAHPHLREYFARQLRTQQPDAWRAAHRRLYEHLCASTKEGDQPTLEDLQPLYQAVAHGCQAGQHQKACDEVYCERILRGTDDDGFYSIKALGSVGSDLQALTCFFDEPWKRLAPALSKANQILILIQTGFCLGASGRLTEAIVPMRVGFEACDPPNDETNAAWAATQLSELELTRGDIPKAIEAAEWAIQHADSSPKEDWPIRSRVALADAFHQAGRSDDARNYFQGAKGIQDCELMSVRMFQYCNFLMAVPERAAWLVQIGMQPSNSERQWESASLTELSSVCSLAIRIGQTNSPFDRLLNYGLKILTQARAEMYRAILEQAEATNSGPFFSKIPHISIGYLHDSGREDYLPRALLTRAWLRFLNGACTGPESAQEDLDEAWEIAERGPMKLFLADIHLHRARLFFREATYPWESPTADLAAARKLIEQCGYGRRKEELEDAEAALRQQHS